MEEAWALAAGLRPVPTSERDWSSTGGRRRDFRVGCPHAVAAVLSCKVQADRWIAPHLAVRTLFDCCRWECWVTQPVQRTSLWPASWLPFFDKSGGSKSVEVQRVWEVYDERLQFMSRHDALHLLLMMFLVLGLFGLVLLRLLLLVLFGSVVVPFLPGLWFLAGVLLCFVGFSWVVIRFGMLDMRRGFKAVVDVFGAMIRSGISLSHGRWGSLFNGIGFLLLDLCILLLWMIFLWIGVWTLVHFSCRFWCSSPT